MNALAICIHIIQLGKMHVGLCGCVNRLGKMHVGLKCLVINE